MSQNLLTTVSLQSSETLSQLTQVRACGARRLGHLQSMIGMTRHRGHFVLASLRSRPVVVALCFASLSLRRRVAPKRLTVTVPERWRRGTAAPAGDRPRTGFPPSRWLLASTSKRRRADDDAKRWVAQPPIYVTTPFRYESHSYRNISAADRSDNTASPHRQRHVAQRASRRRPSAQLPPPAAAALRTHTGDTSRTRRHRKRGAAERSEARRAELLHNARIRAGCAIAGLARWRSHPDH